MFEPPSLTPCVYLLPISSQNLLLDTEGNLKISDFGFSTLNIGDADGDGGARAELLHTTCGTPNYVAPEVLGKDGYDGKKGTMPCVLVPCVWNMRFGMRGLGSGFWFLVWPCVPYLRVAVWLYSCVRPSETAVRRL